MDKKCVVSTKDEERHTFQEQWERAYFFRSKYSYLVCFIYITFLVFVAPAPLCLVWCNAHGKHLSSTCPCSWSLHLLAMPENWSDSPLALLLVRCFIGPWPLKFLYSYKHKMSVPPKAIYKSSAISIKISMALFTVVEKKS